MYIPSWLRTILFVPLFIFFGALAWDYIGDNPLCPIRLGEPITFYYIQKYVIGEGEYANYRTLWDALQNSADYGQFFLPASVGGTKDSNFNLALTVAMFVALSFLMIPWQYTSVIAMFMFIVIPATYIIRVIDSGAKTVETILWPVYGTLVSGIVGMFASIL